MPKRHLISLGLVILSIFVVLGIFWLKNSKTVIREEALPPVPMLFLNDKKINLEIADTMDEQAKGLSGRESLPENGAMLFVFPKSDYWSFWMKDMKFSIDMIWLDENFKVVYLQENVSPKTFPNVFKPSKLSRFVLKMNPMSVTRENINVGDLLEISL